MKVVLQQKLICKTNKWKLNLVCKIDDLSQISKGIIYFEVEI